MRSFDDMWPDLTLLAQAMERYRQVAKTPMDIGVGQPLYPAEVHMTSTICTHEEVSVTDLAAMSGVTKGAVSQTIAKLEKKGLVYREAAPGNHSKFFIRPTGKGREVHEAHMAFHEEHDKEFLSYLGSLPERDRKIVSEFCRQFYSWMHAYEI